MIHRHLARRCNLHARSPPSAKLHSSAAPRQQGGLLTRDFIAKSLYNQDTGYFSTKDVINDLPGPLEFGSMMGELHYRLDVKKAYESKLSAWMTPVETFSPHFSQALARFIAKEAKEASSGGGGVPSRKSPSPPAGRKKGPGGVGGHHQAGGEGLVLYEAGGGTGTNALNVLDWLRREEPKLYERTEYTIVEISPRLAELQRERVCAVHQNCSVVNANVLEWGMSGEVDPRPCFFLGMELLDNLPHDKIAWVASSSQKTEDERRSGSTTASPPAEEEEEEERVGGKKKKKEGDEEQLCEAVVVESPDGGFREVFRPLRDPVIRELLTICPELASMVRNRGLPSPDKAEAESESSPLASLFGKTKLPSLLVGFGAGGADALRPEHCAAFVPTGSLRLVQALRERLPRHRAILADFDSFAGSSAGTEEGGGGGGSAASDESLTAFQAPIVSSRDPHTGSVTDHATYMVPLGSADIFFPTCFERLARLHAAVCHGGSSGGGGGGGGGSNSGRGGGGVVRRGRGLVVKQGEFLREFADLHATRTFSGFNPLVDDFRNSSVFLSGAVLGP